jgi:hypothetical protein
MPLLPYVNRLEPVDDAAIWRYLDLRKFRDLIASEELYFRRADLFTDQSEGLPPEQYAMRVLGLDPYDIHDRVNLNNHLGSLAQHRESYYISCWYLFGHDTLDMWEQYGHDGVAVCSRYGLLKAALDGLLDEAHLGLVRYGTEHLKNTFNALDFITTKQPQYSQDREVRAFLRLELTIETVGPWRGARAFMALDLKGSGLELLPFPQAGLLANAEMRPRPNV